MTEQTILIINRVTPVILLIALGVWMRWRAFLSPSTIGDLQKLVVNAGLPAVMFISFLNIELQPNFVVIFALIFALCVGLLVVGRVLRPVVAPEHPYFPFLMTGFEYGMLAVSLFGGAYGLENFGYIAVMALGHELFIWFVFMAFLLIQRDGSQSPTVLALSFLRNPIILAIFAGVVLNLLGLRETITQGVFTGGIVNALTFLSHLVVPLILIIVGYGIRFQTDNLRDALTVIGVRLGIVVPVALLVNWLIIRTWLGLPFGYEAALFVLVILPPPFIIPLYMTDDNPPEREYVVNILALYTLVSLVIFGVFFALNPVL